MKSRIPNTMQMHDLRLNHQNDFFKRFAVNKVLNPLHPRLFTFTESRKPCLNTSPVKTCHKALRRP